MLLRSKVIISGLILGLASFGGEALAQQQTQSNTAPNTVQQQQRQGMRRRGMRRRGRARALMLQELNLTDQQKEQARTIMRQLTQQWRHGTLSPEGLARAKELRAQMAEHRKTVRTQLDGILTTEQKAKLEEARKTRRTNHGRFRERNPLN
jgi:Spy/CpxP family protein refolding chaperone